MKKIKKISFRIPIYGGKVTVIYTDDFLKTSRKFGKHYEADINSCRGLADRLEHDEYLILIKKYRSNDLGVLAHECLHITNFILKDRGVIIDTENDEAQAYLLGYIIGQIHFLRGKQKIN